MTLEYDIVIATRNRPEALALSIPRMLGQGRRPTRLIVVDSSQAHDAVRTVVEGAARDVDVALKVIHSAPGLPLQRNIGLEHVRAPVVMYPDDDSIWFPDVAESIMRVYERDDGADIGAVCAAESPVPPDDLAAVAGKQYLMTSRDRLKQALGHKRAALERALFPDPFISHGRSRWNVRPTPRWMGDEDAVLVEWMTGFRMSFRTDLIRRYGFDETLRGYALFEDVDASYAIMRGHLVVGARRAKVYHYRFPGKRDNGFAMGALQLLNRAYVVCRNSGPGSVARRHLSRYGWYKLAQYTVGCRGKHGRERLAGAWRALGMIERLLQAPADELPALYARLRDECVDGPATPPSS